MDNVREISKGRGLSAIVAVAIALVIALPALALSFSTSAKVDVPLAYVNIGEDEDMALLTGWGPIVPGDIGGNWGGYGASEEQTRVIWYDELDGEPDPNGPQGVLQIFFSGSARDIWYDHLDGGADDSFELYALGEEGWILIDLYVDEDPLGDPEKWSTRHVDLRQFMLCGECPIYLGGCEFTLMFVATGPAWDGFDTWGQMAFDHVYIDGNGNEMA